MNKIEHDLKRPFPVDRLRWRRGQGGSGELVYITARDVMDRLDQAVGVDGWEERYDFIGGNDWSYRTYL